jgi:hypothetical protein
MTQKKDKNLSTYLWVEYLLITFLFFNLLIILFNFIVDPYQQYRKATLYTFTVQDQRYLNAGLAKNYDYDSIVVGSSMTENFYADDITKILHFENVIKLPFHGSSIFEEVALIKTATKHKKIKNIIFGFDIYSFNGDITPLNKSIFFPSYMYDDNFFNDLLYLLNFKVLRKSIKSLSNKYDKKKINTQLNSIYNWQQNWQNSFNIKNVLKLYNLKKNNYNDLTKQQRSKFFHSFRFDILKKHFDTELLSVIQKNPQTNFYIFYPPYSVLAYKLMLHQNILQDTVEFKKYVFFSLQKYKNVKIYDFQIAKSITNNLHYYKDTQHYNENINKWMLEQIAKDNYLVTQSNIEQYSKKLLTNTKIYKVPENAF